MPNPECVFAGRFLGDLADVNEQYALAAAVGSTLSVFGGGHELPGRISHLLWLDCHRVAAAVGNQVIVCSEDGPDPPHTMPADVTCLYLHRSDWYIGTENGDVFRVDANGINCVFNLGGTVTAITARGTKLAAGNALGYLRFAHNTRRINCRDAVKEMRWHPVEDIVFVTLATGLQIAYPADGITTLMYVQRNFVSLHWNRQGTQAAFIHTSGLVFMKSFPFADTYRCQLPDAEIAKTVDLGERGVAVITTHGTVRVWLLFGNAPPPDIPIR